MKWVNDYKAFAKKEHERRFSFFPNGAITNEREFTDALFAYADEKNKNLVITKECMYPEFLLDGIEYIASRNYTYMGNIPVAEVNCECRAMMTEKEKLTKKQLLFKVLHVGWPAIFPVIFGIITASDMPSLLDAICIMIPVLGLTLAGIMRNYFLYWNLDN